MKELGEKIKEARIENGLSQTQLAKLLQVSNGIISTWENNIYEPKATYIKKLCEVLHISADYLLGLSDDNCFQCSKNNIGTINNNGSITFQ